MISAGALGFLVYGALGLTALTPVLLLALLYLDCKRGRPW